MSPTFACLAGLSVYRLQEQGSFAARVIGPRETPFGRSEVISLVEAADAPYYLLPSHGHGKYQRSAGFINQRANFYALKDLGVECVFSWSAVGAISHNYNMGDMVMVSDLIDRTTRRPHTFYENSGLGVLRQFPVFCPFLREGLAQALTEMHTNFRETGTVAVTEGPRLETPAEVRLHAAGGAELVGHNFAPEAFLAKELELCFAALAYVVNYAETGSRYRPFSAADLFGSAAPTDSDRTKHAVSALPAVVERLSRFVAEKKRSCECATTMHYEAQKHQLPEDWRKWFAPAETWD